MDQEKHLSTAGPSGVLCDLTQYSEWSAGLFNVNDFSLLIRAWYDMLQEQSEATAETETSLLLSGLVINCYVCLFCFDTRWKSERSITR